jgi:hypothetical protein
MTDRWKVKSRLAALYRKKGPKVSERRVALVEEFRKRLKDVL